MKRRITLSIALTLSVVLLSLMSSDSTAWAQQPPRFVVDTGVITLPTRTDAADPEASPRELALVATSAYIYGYPLVLMEFTRVTTLLAAGTPVNTFIHARDFPEPDDTTVVRPNTDTLYSTAFLDLTVGPIVMHVPDTAGRYYQMQMLDAWSNTFASPGARTTGTTAQDFYIVGPDWRGHLPRGITRIDSPTNLVWIIGRTRVDGEAEFPVVHAIQDQYDLTPLSSFPVPPRGAARTSAAGTISGSHIEASVQAMSRHLDGAGMTLPPPEQVALLSGVNFFRILSFLMCDNPAANRDAPAVRTFRAIDFIPCREFNPSHELIVNAAPPIALGQIGVHAQSLGVEENGWSLNYDIGTYGVHYLDRAAIALYGFGANLPEDAFYPGADQDGAGQPLNGSINGYTIHFTPEEIPPVDEFWSITLYTQDGFFYDNPDGRYTIHDTEVVLNADGSLDIYLQNAPPSDATLIPNWLPTPMDQFNLTLRMYSPQQSALDGDWVPPPINQTRPLP